MTIKPDRNAKLKAFGLSPEHIAGLEKLGHLPKFAEGGPVFEDEPGFKGGKRGAPPIKTLDAEAALPAPVPDAQPTAGGLPVPVIPDWQRPGTFDSPIPGAGASGSFDESADSAPASPVTPVMMDQPGQTNVSFALPVGAPGGPQGGNADIPTAPALQAPNYLAEAAGQRNVAQAETTGAAEQARVSEQALEKMRVEDAAWKAAEAVHAQGIDKARQEASKSPVADWTTGHKVTAALAVALGAFGSSITKTPNYALQIMDKQIDDEVRGRHTALAALERQYGSAKDAHLALRSALIENLRLDLGARAARSTSDVQKQKIGLIDQQLANKQAEADNQIKNNQFAMRAETAKLQIEEEKVGAQRSAHAKDMMEKYGERYVPGVGVMRSDTDAKSAKELFLAKQSVDKNVALLEQLRRKYPTGAIPTGPDQALAQQAATEMTLGLKSGLSLGVLSQSDLDLLDKMGISNPLSMFKRYDSVMAKLGGIRRGFETKMAAHRALALIPEGGAQRAGAGGSAGGVPGYISPIKGGR